MKDKGVVISTENDLADVKIDCLSVCNECAVHSLCIGKSEARGILKVKNPCHAKPGEKVNIAVPEERYSRALIFLFGTLLTVSLAGLGMGYLCSMLFPLPVTETSLAGLIMGLGLSVFLLFARFRKKNKAFLYPVITSIITNGGSHE